jgi:hypothetical protein
MIAISYRREDSLPIAGRLYDRLQATFGKKNVFMDFDSIPPGMDFREQIKQTIERSNLVVAIIGPNWLGQQPDSSRRIDNPADFVRLEITCALKRGIPVIPVLVNDTQMPSPEKLPPEIEELAFRNAVTLDTGIDFNHHADRLIAGIRKTMAVGPQPGGPRRIPEPMASLADAVSFRKVVTWGLAILFAVAGSAIWFLAGHRREHEEKRTKQVAVVETPAPAKAEPKASETAAKSRALLPGDSESQTEWKSATSPSIEGYDPGIAFVDMNRIFKEYTKTKSAETKINEAKQIAKKEYDDRAGAYKKALDEINSLNRQLDWPTLSASAKTAKVKERDGEIAAIKH